MNATQPQVRFGLDDCSVEAAPLALNQPLGDAFSVTLKLVTVDRPKDTPITVYLPKAQAVRLIKELASSVLSNMPPTNG